MRLLRNRRHVPSSADAVCSHEWLRLSELIEKLIDIAESRVSSPERDYELSVQKRIENRNEEYADGDTGAEYQHSNSCRGSDQAELPTHERSPQVHCQSAQCPLEPVIHELLMI